MKKDRYDERGERIEEGELGKDNEWERKGKIRYLYRGIEREKEIKNSKRILREREREEEVKEKENGKE